MAVLRALERETFEYEKWGKLENSGLWNLYGQKRKEILLLSCAKTVPQSDMRLVIVGTIEFATCIVKKVNSEKFG